MTKRCLWCVLALACLMTAPVFAQSTPACGPLDDGRVADVFYQDTTIFFDPIVEYEYNRITLTISGPCETIVRTFDRGEQVFFDVREIERVTDGTYTWHLRVEPTIDPVVQEALHESRGSGKEDAIWWSFWQSGKIPAGPSVESASFSVERGAIIDPNSGEEKRASLDARGGEASLAAAAIAGGGAEASEGGGGPVLGTKDFVINDDLIVDGSACIGFDCVNGESFGFDTIRLKENNLRIKFDDTSTAASFPRNDWQLTANDSANGGASKFSIDDISNARTPFTVEANAPSHSLYVDDGGRVGMGTSTPSVEIHVIDGDTPTLRLQQDGSSGFAPQTWDVAGNETNFFVRDVTNGSALPFRIRPGASSNAIFIDDTDDVGLGTSSPDERLHVTGSDGSNKILVEETNGTATLRNLFTMRNNGGIQLLYDRTDGSSNDWQMSNFSATFELSVPGSSPAQFSLNANGNLTIGGTLTELSTREAKTNFESLDPRAVLARVQELPISVWTYKQDTGSRHLGPMAEDFYEAFGLGSDNKTIAPGDKAGVALAAIQGLHQVVEDKDAAITELERTIESLQQQNDELAARLEALEKLLD